MRTLDHYIARTVLLSMLVVMGLIISVDFIFSVAEELGEISTYYALGDAMSFVMMTIPTSIYELLPYVALGGALIGLGILASSNELIVILAAGISTTRIAWAVMKPTLLVMVMSLVLGEWIAPQLEQQAQSNRALVQSGGEAINTEHGDWHKIGNEFAHVNAVMPGGRELFGITRYKLHEDRRIISSSFAEHGEYLQDATGGYWLLENVQETLFGIDEIGTAHHDRYEWRVDLSPELLSVLLVRPERQSISGLYRFAQYFDAEGLDSSSYFLAFWKKLLQPLATASLVILAISFVFGPLREATMGSRVFVAIAIGLAFTIVQRMVGPASLFYGLSPLAAVLLPIILSLILGAFLLRRT
jgi:lipopolysaccharide export system permease protein